MSLWGPGFQITLITNVHDPKRLTPPAAVGQQFYATAILYNMLRVFQAKIAATASIAEMLCVDKLFPTLIEHHIVATCIA